MKKDTLIFIVVSLILGAGLIIGLNKLRPASGALVEDNTVDELQNINTNEKENLDQLSSNPTREKDYSMPATFSANQT